MLSPKVLNLYRLLLLVAYSRDLLATDPRDKIYSVIGLSKAMYDGQLGEFDSDKLLVDYSASVEDIYSSFAVAVVSATNRIDILGFCNQDERFYVRR
jgi:hypothetical protein